MKKPNISQKSVLLAFSGVIVVIYLNIANAEIKEISNNDMSNIPLFGG